MGSLEKALYRLNGYRALASPVYLSLSYLADCEKQELTNKKSRNNDPVYQAFVLNGRMERLAREEYEFKKDYSNLSTRCEEYAVALLNLCRNMKEIGCVMTMPSIKGLAHVQVRTANKAALKLTVLNFAIKNKNERVSMLTGIIIIEDTIDHWINLLLALPARFNQAGLKRNLSLHIVILKWNAAVFLRMIRFSIYVERSVEYHLKLEV